MKKIVILLAFLFTLTGCTLEYNLVIDERTFEEVITINENDSTKLNSPVAEGTTISYQDRVDWLASYPIYVFKNAHIDPYDDSIIIDGVKYYEKQKIVTGEEYGVSLITNGEIDEINDLRSLSHCYEIARVLNNKDEYVISTSFKNMCFENYPLLDELTINITTDMKVTSNNADSVSGNTYTWKITRANYDNKSISLAMQYIRDYNQDKYNEEQEEKREEQRKKIEKQKNTTLKILGVVGIAFLVIVLGLGIVIFIKNQKENKL